MKKIISYVLVFILGLNIVLSGDVGEVNAAVNDEFDTHRLRWVDYILGGSYDVNNVDVQSQLTDINADATTHWNSMDKSVSRTYLWDDLTNGETDGSPLGSSYGRLKTLTLAYAMEGTALHNNQQLLNDIIEALDWLNIHWYNENEPEDGNWWWWEIGIPNSLNDMTAILYDDLTSQQINSYMTAVNAFVADPKVMYYGKGTSEAANRVDLCKNTILEGIITKNNTRIIVGRDALSDVFPYVTTGNGYYTDGSYVDHSNYAYTHSYGVVLISGLAKLMYLLNGSSWDITDPQINNIYNWVYDSYEPTVYKMQAFDHLKGRAISREGTGVGNLGSGKSILSIIAMLAKSAPAQDAAYFRSIVKHMMEENTQFDSVGSRIYSITMFEEIKNDTSIIPRGELIKHIEFNNMDRSAHFASGFAFTVSKSSKRIGRFELINGENQKGWYTGDGMTYLYNDDYYAYNGDYWATVDYYRLPGTTVDTRTRTTGDYSYGDGEGVAANSWSGGVTLNEQYGASGMELQAYGATLTANKSWFMFDDEVVALGSGITSTDGRTIETVVEQRKLNTAGDNALTVNSIAKSNALGWQETMTGTNWAHLTGTAATGADIGYYFPGSSTVKGIRKAQSGTWYDVNMNASSSTDIRTDNYMTLLFDHGVNPANATYSYVLLPNKSTAQVEGYSVNPDVEIISNTETVHCVKETGLNIVAANFWGDQTQTADIITSDKRATVMTKVNADDTLDVVVSDPTMENIGAINIEINKDAPGGVISNDPNIIVLQTSPTIKMKVNVNGANGKGFKAQFNIDPTATPVPTVWYSSPDYTSAYSLGTANTGIVTTEFDVTPLANNIDGVIGYADTATAVGHYSDMAMLIRMNSSGDFDARNGGGYAAVNALSYSANSSYHVKLVANLYAKTYSVYVTPQGGSETVIASDYAFRSDAPIISDVGQLILKDNSTVTPYYKVENHMTDYSVPAVYYPQDDAYVRDGSYANDNFGGSSDLVVKSDGSSYARKSYIKFDFSGYSRSNAQKATIRFNVHRTNAAPSRTVKIYGTADESWSENTVTWNSGPSADTYITSVDVTGNTWYEIDVTDYVNSNMSDKVISLLIVNEGPFTSTGDFAISSKENTNAKAAELIIE